MPPTSVPPIRCSDGARERRDPQAATAAPARRWLLVEHPGPWTVDALQGSGIDPAVQQTIRAAAAAAAARVLLVRRPGRTVRGADRSWTVLDHASGSRTTGRWDDDRDLLAAAAALGRPGEEPADPLLLVCTHGRHDVCCAVRGRPVAAALAARWPAATWECSHVGGDRFAPNLLVVPDGTTYGTLDEASAVRVVEQHLDRGLVDVDLLRGPATEPPVVQAAVVAALRRWGPAGPRALRGNGFRETGPDRWEVTLAGERPLPTSVTARVERTWAEAAHLTCRATRSGHAGVLTATLLDPA